MACSTVSRCSTQHVRSHTSCPSLLPPFLPLPTHVQGSVVEVLVARGEVAFIVTNPDEGAEMVWQNNSTVSRPYK